MSRNPTAEERYLLDREAILGCVSRGCRGVDRHDRQLLASVFDPRAALDYGEWSGSAADFVAWADEAHRAEDLAHSHNITSHNCEIDGDRAVAETYVIRACLKRDGRTAVVSGGRYLDRFERRDGEWRIVQRRVVADWALEADGTESHNDDGYIRGRWDQDDITYMRPLALSPELMAKIGG
jgi:hypothetical protein